MGEVSQYAPEAVSPEVACVPQRFIPIIEIKTVLQVREAREHKYYLSERNGSDVGRGFTLEHWIASPQAERFNEEFYANHEAIEDRCAQLCGQRCTVYALFDAIRHDSRIYEQVVRECREEEKTHLDGLPSDEAYVLLKEYLTKRCLLPTPELHDLIEEESERRRAAEDAARRSLEVGHG